MAILRKGEYITMILAISLHYELYYFGAPGARILCIRRVKIHKLPASIR